MFKIIDGKKISSDLKIEIAKKIFNLNGLRPSLAIILVGNREDSRLYVSLKEKEARFVGVDTHLYRLEENVKESDLFEVIDFLNKDEQIDSILLQLPLPKHLDANRAVERINPLKDADGFHSKHPEYVVSPVISAVKKSLENTELNFKEKSACILYNSDVFGKSLKELLISFGFKKFLDKKESNKADLIITALGKINSIKEEDVKEGAVVIDIGTVKKDNKVKGDVDFDNVCHKTSFITPVPGGIGPMTIAFLLKNVFEIFKIKNKIKND